MTSENVLCVHQCGIRSGHLALVEIKETEANKANQETLLSVQDQRDLRGAVGRWAFLDQKAHVSELGYF